MGNTVWNERESFRHACGVEPSGMPLSVDSRRIVSLGTYDGSADADTSDLDSPLIVAIAAIEFPTDGR
ncbi:hypothetical protein [Burkholderia diffusa]|uniref:hypothetical protein n=1 Tax=Burkholderia diffusa TaxID=488732 RepID=UPI00075278FD|nr:hypothetical protein [Burkholderia diffusa]